MKTPARQKSYFFCGIGGSGMMPLAVICAEQGFRVSGSDRGRDKGDSPEKFAALEKLGIRLFPQDGSGVAPGVDTLVISTAVEDSIPDIRAAKTAGIPIIKRAELLAELSNGAGERIAVAGTSGKSTVTGMIATMLVGTGHDPTIMNGGMIRNFMVPSHKGLANMRVGKGDIFVTEADESDGSIALYQPTIAVVNNVTLDHKSLEELDGLFRDFIAKARVAVLNADDPRVMALKGEAKEIITYGIDDPGAMIRAANITQQADGVDFTVGNVKMRLHQPGLHNVRNALAALAVSQAMGMELSKAAKALEKFEGIKRRFEIVGTKNGITVIDDFGHNPDKIAATLKTLKAFPGRLIVMFQPHGYGPLKLMGREIAETFAEYLGADDTLLMPEAYYAGGTVDRSVTAKHVVEMVGKQAHWFATRDEIPVFILGRVKPGDRVVIMGSRDDTLSDFVRGILNSLSPEGRGLG